MGFTTDEEMVEVNFFSTPGVYCGTEALRFHPYTSGKLIQDVFKDCLKEQFGGRFQGMIAVCFDPHHIHGHPIMVTIPE